jgi:hypothetical protein
LSEKPQLSVRPHEREEEEETTQDKTSMLDNDEATKAAALSNIASLDPDTRREAAEALKSLRRKIQSQKTARQGYNDGTNVPT